MTGLRLDARENTERWEMSLVGELDVETAADLSDALAAVPLETTTVLDLDGLTFMDSSGLRALLHAHLDGRRLVLTHPRPAIRRVLDIAEVADLFTIEPAAG